MNKYKVQVIEDEINICNFMKMIFETHEYQAIFSQRGESGLTMFWSHHPDVVILDLGLPDMDGTEVIKQIRKASDTPIIVLSARSNEADKVEALDLGANDYLTKPFHSRELLARIRAMTREQTVQATSRLQVGNITLDRATFELSSPTGRLRLANKEFQMLELLMCNPRNLISTERFLEKIWGYDNEAEINVVWVYISYLRKKLAALHGNIQIKARRNAGYYLEETI